MTLAILLAMKPRNAHSSVFLMPHFCWQAYECANGKSIIGAKMPSRIQVVFLKGFFHGMPALRKNDDALSGT